VGYALADCVGVGVGVGDAVVGVAVGDGDAVVDVAVGDDVEPSEGLAGVVAGALAGLLGTAVNEAVPVTEGVMMTGVVVEEVAEQAESAQARMTETPQPTAASRTPDTDPAIVVRAFMEPPDGSGVWRICFPIPALETASEQKSAWPARSLPGPADGRSGESADGP
jgi:hypothetical protein